jgi:hypothetical protein
MINPATSKSLLYTGIDVVKEISTAENNRTNEPINIQNSLEVTDSSFAGAGIDFHLRASNIKEASEKTRS